MKKIDRTRVDYVFSYWIFFGYLLFYFRIIPYNPKHVLILAGLFNCFQLIVYFSPLHTSHIRLFLFILINICIKLIPIFSIWKTTVTNTDNMFYMGLFVLYIGWLTINKVNVIEIVKKNIHRHPPANNKYFFSTPISDFLISYFRLEAI